MRTKLLVSITLLMLSATMAFAQGLTTVATMTVADNKTGNVNIEVGGVAGDVVSINGVDQTLGGNKTFLVNVDTEKTIVIEATSASSITHMYCNGNELTSLDVSGCTALIGLYCYNNKLASLDISGCVALQMMSCYNNELTSLDVSNCNVLRTLSCYNNKLTSLNVSGCVALQSLSCYNNELTSLDVSGYTSLLSLSCYNNKLTSLNVSGCVALTNLSCQNNVLSFLDISGCVALTSLYCQNNELTSLDISDCAVLERIYANGQKIVVNIPFNDNNTTGVNISFNGMTEMIASGQTFSFPTALIGDPFSGIISIVRAADERNRYSVTLVAEEGVSTNKAVGIHTVIEGYDFSFYTTLADEYADYNLIVLVNGNEVAPTIYDNMYIIENIDKDKEVTFELKKADNTTANQSLRAAAVSASTGTITIEASNNASVQVVSFAGQIVYNAEVVGTTTVNVPAGIYAVVVGGVATKVVVK